MAVRRAGLEAYDAHDLDLEGQACGVKVFNIFNVVDYKRVVRMLRKGQVR